MAVPSNRKRAPPRNDTETVINRFQYVAIGSTPNSSIEHIGPAGRSFSSLLADAR